MSLTGLGSLFSGGGVKVFMPNLSGGINGANPVSDPNQYSVTGGPGVMSYQPTTGNTGPVTPPSLQAALAAAGNAAGAFGNGLNSLGGPFSGLAPSPAHVSSNPFYINGRSAYDGPGSNVTQLQPFQQTAPAVNVAQTIASHFMPKPPEPTHTYSTEGEWGGGITGGAGAPQQFGQTWLQSANGGANWSPQYGVKGTLGQAPSGGWAQMNNGGSSPQWIQRG